MLADAQTHMRSCTQANIQTCTCRHAYALTPMHAPWWCMGTVTHIHMHVDPQMHVLACMQTVNYRNTGKNTGTNLDTHISIQTNTSIHIDRHKHKYIHTLVFTY